MTLYYVERKCFYFDSHGIEHQFADGGELPILYTTYERAKGRAERMIKTCITLYGAVVTISNNDYPCKRGDLKFACRLEEGNKRVRYEIRVYEVEIRK